MARESDTPATGAPAEHIHDSICDTIGETPLVRLHRLPAEARCEAEILGKLEFLNPLASVKDRIALAMVEAAERAGKSAPATPRSSSRPRATPASRSPSSAPPRATGWSSPCRRACRSSAARC